MGSGVGSAIACEDRKRFDLLTINNHQSSINNSSPCDSLSAKNSEWRRSRCWRRG